MQLSPQALPVVQILQQDPVGPPLQPTMTGLAGARRKRGSSRVILGKRLMLFALQKFKREDH